MSDTSSRSCAQNREGKHRALWGTGTGLAWSSTGWAGREGLCHTSSGVNSGCGEGAQRTVTQSAVMAQVTWGPGMLDSPTTRGC